jgi:hypothetical protein
MLFSKYIRILLIIPLLTSALNFKSAFILPQIVREWHPIAIEKNIDKVRETKLKSYHKLKDSPKNKLYKKMYSQTLEVRLKNALRSRIKIALKKPAKKTRTHILVGCSIQELKLHIEKQFQPGMTWDNWAQFGWHLDHIKPLSSAKNIEEMESLCHYTNLQPLWWRDNLSKSDKIVEH